MIACLLAERITILTEDNPGSFLSTSEAQIAWSYRDLFSTRFRVAAESLFYVLDEVRGFPSSILLTTLSRLSSGDREVKPSFEVTAVSRSVKYLPTLASPVVVTS